MNLKKPKNFNQKIQWLKLNDTTELKTLLADKYLMRSWVEQYIGEKYLVPLLGVWDNFEEINFEKLPDKFVLKCNHGSGFNHIELNKDKIDKKEVKKKFDEWTSLNFAFMNGFELQYKNIKPKIICEEYLEENLTDCQVWCANGKILFIAYIKDPHGDNRKITFNENWKKLDFVTSKPIMEQEVEKPIMLEEIKEVANKISKSFKFVRVDFYITQHNQLKLSEITFTPASGVVRWYPESANYRFEEVFKI